jgi:hypothetical protein
MILRPRRPECHNRSAMIATGFHSRRCRRRVSTVVNCIFPHPGPNNCIPASRSESHPRFEHATLL